MLPRAGVCHRFSQAVGRQVEASTSSTKDRIFAACSEALTNLVETATIDAVKQQLSDAKSRDVTTLIIAASGRRHCQQK